MSSNHDKKFSIIFPIYKEGNVVENILYFEEQEYPKEYIVFVSAPKEDFLKELEHLKKQISNLKLIVKEERTGKVSAVNEAVDYAKGKYILFIDADVKVINVNLEKLANLLEKYELVDIPKIILPISNIGKAICIEYISYLIILSMFSSIKKSIVLNGAIFATRKDTFFNLGKYDPVIIEDVDYATKVYKNGGKYYLFKEAKAYVYPVTSLKKWIDQRKRWAYGGIEWVERNWKSILKFYMEYPLRSILALILFNPFFFIILFILAMPDSFLKGIVEKILNIFNQFSILQLKYIDISLLVYFIKFLFLIILTIVVYKIYKEYGKRFKENIKFTWVVRYLYLFSVLWLFIIIGTNLFYIIFKKPPKFNWKI